MTMATVRVDCTIENASDRSRSAAAPHMLVDEGSERTWISGRTLDSLGIRQEKKDVTLVNGQRITRNIGFAVIRCGEFFTVDEVVFAKPGDLPVLGARRLGGFNARVDAYQKTLVAAGPILAA
jgi:hypothetical protein